MNDEDFIKKCIKENKEDLEFIKENRLAVDKAYQRFKNAL